MAFAPQGSPIGSESSMSSTNLRTQGAWNVRARPTSKSSRVRVPLLAHQVSPDPARLAIEILDASEEWVLLLRDASTKLADERSAGRRNGKLRVDVRAEPPRP
jgi:hypothetical protein